MKAFTYYNPTRIEFGKGKEKNIGQYIAEYGITKVLIVYGSERIRKSGLFDTVADSLTDNKISYEALGGVQSNPVLSKVYEGVALAKSSGAEAVLAVGGGSVLDSSKAIAAGATYDGDVWDFFTYKAVPNKALKIFDIITLAATGSEMNNFAVVTKEETKEKFNLAGAATFPTVSVINPELQATVTNEYLVYSAADIFAHSLDMYLSATYLPQYMAGYVENILKTVIRTTEILLPIQTIMKPVPNLPGLPLRLSISPHSAALKTTATTPILSSTLYQPSTTLPTEQACRSSCQLG